MKNMFSVGEVARILDVARSTVIYWIKDGKINAFQTPGGDNRIVREDLVAFMKEYSFPLDAIEGYSSRRIVAIDDDRQVLDVIVKALSYTSGFEVRGCTSWFEGGFLTREIRPDLLIIDIKLRETDGRNVCEIVRKKKEFKHIAILGISGSVEVNEEDILKEGFDGFLRKPIDIETLADAAHELIARKRKLSSKHAI